MFAYHISGAGPLLRSFSPKSMSTKIPRKPPAILARALCAIALLAACGCSEPALRISGALSSNDVSQIEGAVRQDITQRLRSPAAHPIKSIRVGTNGTAEVWYSAKELRWGEGGYVLAKGSNGWNITTQLFRYAEANQLRPGDAGLRLAVFPCPGIRRA